MVAVDVTASRDYPHSARRLWEVFAEPELAASLDDRVTLVGSAETPGEVGSSYELEVAYGPLRLRQHVRVVESARPTLLQTVTTMEGQEVARQTAVIEPTPGGCTVTWTVAIRPSRLAAGRARRKSHQELVRWLAAADDVAGQSASQEG